MTWSGKFKSDKGRASEPPSNGAVTVKLHELISRTSRDDSQCPMIFNHDTEEAHLHQKRQAHSKRTIPASLPPETRDFQYSPDTLLSWCFSIVVEDKLAQWCQEMLVSWDR